MTASTAERAAIDRAILGAFARHAASLGPLAAPIKHAIEGGGKRLRGLLTMAAYQAAGGTRDASPLAAALEIVHAYSLVHDDLPCMDDDVMRRGRPTVHVVYGVDSATVAGVAMVPLAMAAAEIVARSEDELQLMLGDLRARMARTVSWRVESARNRHRAAGRSLQHAAAALTQRAKHRVSSLAGRLDALSPLSTLHRGYAVPRDLEGRTLREIAEFAPGVAFELLLRDGSVRATTDAVTPSPPEESP
jgi:hypothetical protein